MFGTLYIVATPIGNLEDLSFRAVRVLGEADYILAEDTRVTGKLREKCDIQAKLLNYHQHSGEERKLEILRLLLEGKNVALVTDAGTPGISDPGNELIAFLLEKEERIKVVPVPGPSALTAALSVCGMKVNNFVFLGFLPKKKREKIFAWLKNGGYPFLFFESPKRILKTLKVLEGYFGQGKKVIVLRELTKIYETIYRGEISEVINNFEKEKSVKGEIVVVVEG